MREKSPKEPPPETQAEQIEYLGILTDEQNLFNTLKNPPVAQKILSRFQQLSNLQENVFQFENQKVEAIDCPLYILFPELTSTLLDYYVDLAFLLKRNQQNKLSAEIGLRGASVFRVHASSAKKAMQLLEEEFAKDKDKKDKIFYRTFKKSQFYITGSTVPHQPSQEIFTIIEFLPIPAENLEKELENFNLSAASLTTKLNNLP